MRTRGARAGLTDIAWREFRITKQLSGGLSIVDAVNLPGWFWYWELGFGRHSEGTNLRATLENLKETNKTNRSMLERQVEAPRPTATSRANRKRRLILMERRAKKLMKRYTQNHQYR